MLSAARGDRQSHIRPETTTATADNAHMVGRKKRARRETDPLAAYRRIRKPMPPPEKVLADERRKLEEKDAERQIREEP
jgi:hypothetical protein